MTTETKKKVLTLQNYEFYKTNSNPMPDAAIAKSYGLTTAQLTDFKRENDLIGKDYGLRGRKATVTTFKKSEVEKEVIVADKTPEQVIPLKENDAAKERLQNQLDEYAANKKIKEKLAAKNKEAMQEKEIQDEAPTVLHFEETEIETPVKKGFLGKSVEETMPQAGEIIKAAVSEYFGKSEVEFIEDPIDFPDEEEPEEVTAQLAEKSSVKPDEIEQIHLDQLNAANITQVELSKKGVQELKELLNSDPQILGGPIEVYAEPPLLEPIDKEKIQLRQEIERLKKEQEWLEDRHIRDTDILVKAKKEAAEVEWQKNYFNHLEYVVGEVKKERLRQIRKWGFQRHAHGDWLAILMEEVGESAQAMQRKKGWGKTSDSDNLYEELIHTAAVAVAFAEQVRDEEKNPDGTIERQMTEPAESKSLHETAVGERINAEIEIVKRRKGKTSVFMIDGEHFIKKPEHYNQGGKKKE